MLIASDGTHAVNITLFGQYVPAGFTDRADGHGGALVTYRLVSASTVGAGHLAPAH